MVNGSRGELTNQDIMHKDHLNGVINEALRLHPPVPTRVARMTPPEGLTVGDTHVPGNMKVWAPQYAIGRSESIP